MPSHEEAKKQQTKDRILDTINERHCQWPFCKEEHELEVKLTVLLALPDGRQKPLKDKTATGKFCLYHAHLAKACCSFGITQEPTPDQSNFEGRIIGPFDIVYLIEQAGVAASAWREAKPGVLLPCAFLGGD